MRYQRVLDAVADLETLAVTDPRVSEFLSRDDTVVARMMAAVDAVEAGGMTVDRGDTADAHLRRAVDWRRDRAGRGSAPRLRRGHRPGFAAAVGRGRGDGVTDQPDNDAVAEVDAMVAAIGPQLACRSSTAWTRSW